MPAIPVKWLRQSTMGGCTQLGTITEGTFIAQLKEFLITGFNPQTPATATYAGGVVTLTFGSAHGFVPYQVIEVTNAVDTDYNGTFRVVAVEDITAFTLTYVPDVAPTASTTGVTVKQPPVGGWELVFEDIPNFRMTLKRTHVDATPYYFKIHNSADYQGGAGSNSWWAWFEIVENYVDETTYDLVQAYAWPASNRYRATDAESWLFADDRMLYHVVNYANGTAVPTVICVGDINSVIPGDRGHCISQRVYYDLTGLASEWDVTTDDIRNYFPRNNDSLHKWMMTQYHNLPGITAWYTMGYNSSTWGGLLAHPNAANNGMVLSTQPLMVLENGVRGVTMRGFLPGILEPLNWSGTLAGQITSGHPGMESVPVQWIGVTNHIDNALTNAAAPFVIRLDNWRDQVG